MRIFFALCSASILAACGGDAEGIAVQGDFAPGGTLPGRVFAVEAAVGTEVSDDGFKLDGLATSPISLRLVQTGDTVGRIDIADLPAGSRAVLHGLRTDTRSGRAFPSTVELTGAQSVTVNGIRMMNEGAIPSTVDADAVVLAASADRRALLVRPANEQLPDLRVVVTPVTAVVTRDSLAADISTLSIGDSVRVGGKRKRGFIVADRLTLALDSAAPTGSSADGEDEPSDTDRSTTTSGSTRSSSAPARSSTSEAPAARSPAPAVVTRAPAPTVRAAPQERGRGQGRARARERGAGNGKPKKGKG
ncbi:MAG TPA: hypothetical protein VF710_06020 [Longimicrobium sp.]|jgi:hypothetical protein